MSRLVTRPAVLVLAVLAAGCSRPVSPRAPGTRTDSAPPVGEPIYAGGLASAWEEHGSAQKERREGGHDRLGLAGNGWWVFSNDALKGAWGGVVFRLHAPAAWGDFLEVRVDSDAAEVYRRVLVVARHRHDEQDDWTQVFIPIEELDPELVPFTRVILRAATEVPAPGFVEIDDLGLTVADAVLVARADSSRDQAGEPVAFVVDCTAPAQPISPYIYGIALSPRQELQGYEQWKLSPTIRRWGGNATSRYNWELGNAWNAGADGYYENADLAGKGDFTWKTFLQFNRDHRVRSAITLPMLGWVARDLVTSGFPVADFGKQQQVDAKRGAGNGVSRDGRPLAPGPPTRTSVAAPPEFIGRWVQAIEGADREGVAMYFLDDEPGLWHEVHRDVHPQPVTSDELLQRTVAYASAVRRANPEALIAGPSEWGWTGYLYSAADRLAGLDQRPDRKAHGDLPLVEWYLRSLAEAEKKSGTRLLDVLDLHFYPPGMGIGVGVDGRTDAETNALRIRSTRALWDPRYVDESFIHEPVQLIPRMREWVARNKPGLKLSIGEYNFGAERHPSGGLALAEALGRFGQQGLYSAFYWTYPPEGSPAFWAFRAYRNFDGKGAAFESLSMPTSAPPETSLFAARSEDGRRVTLVLLNLSSGQIFEGRVNLQGCAEAESQRVFGFTGDPRGFLAREAPLGKAYRLPPSSITVVELQLAPP
jgi:Glycoside hydrolase family 44